MNKKSFATTALIAFASAIASAQTPTPTPGNNNYWGGPPPNLYKQRAEAIKDAREERTKQCVPNPSADQIEDCKLAKRELDRLLEVDAQEDRAERKLKEAQNSCEKLVNGAEKELALAEEACGKAGTPIKDCFTKVDSCQKRAIENDLDDPDDVGGAAAFCDKALANNCPGLPAFNQGRDYRQEEKEAKKDQKEAKRDLDQAMKKQREEQIDLAKAQREMRENEEDQALANRDTERALANSMKKALEGLSEDQKAAFEAAQGTFTKMEAEYMKMRKEARDAADAVEQVKDDLQVMCRASAEKKFAEAEKVRLAALAARKKNVGAGTNVSGSSKRTKAAADRARQTNYVAFFNECSSGQSADGVGGNNRIKTAERAKASADKFLAEKAQLIEKERANMLEKLKQMEQDATNRKAKIVEEMNEKLERENENRQSIAKKNAARAAEFSQRQQLAMKSTQDEIDTANKELMDAQREQSVAGTNLACQGRNAGRSESKRDRLEDGYTLSIPAITRAISSCDKLDLACPKNPIATCAVLRDSKKPKPRYGPPAAVKTGT